MKNTQYMEMNEAQRFYQERLEIENAPLADRKEAQGKYFKAMKESPALVAERMCQLFSGDYGYMEQKIAVDIANNKRMNRVAALSCLIAQKEWLCPQRMATEAWKKLSKTEQDTLNTDIMTEINLFLAQAKMESNLTPEQV